MPDSQGVAASVTPEIRRRPVTLDEVKRDREVDVYIAKADEYTGAIGYTEHGLRHANLVASIASNILRLLGRAERAM